MNETPLDTLDAGDAESGSLPAMPDAQVRELLVMFAKALRAFQLYEENNPVYRRFVYALRDALVRLWEGRDELRLTVEESRLRLDAEPVYVNESRAESLAFLFYKDGIREIALLPGFEAELEPFLSLVDRARHAVAESDDLITLLWQADFRSFRYSYIDFLDEGVILPERGEGAEQGQLDAAFSDVTAAGLELAPAGDTVQAVSHESFRPTLYALDPKEMALLEEELRREMRRDLRRDVLNALFDRLEEPEDRERQSRILGILGTLLPNFLSRGALEAAGSTLEELAALERRPEVFDDERRRAASDLVDEASSAEVVSEMVRALEDGSIVTTPRQLGGFLVHLRADALAPLLRACETVAVRQLQPVLREAVAGIAARNRDVLVALLSSPDPVVAAGASRLSGWLRVPEAAGALEELLGHEDPAVRLAAVEAAVMLRASTVARGLLDALTDPERDVRIAAARGLGTLRYRPAAGRFRALVKGKELRAADVSEKVAFFEGYGSIGDPDAAPFLHRLLNGKGLFGRREPADLRAAAALALGKIATPEALGVLEAAVADEDPVVRSAVNRALREASEAAG